MPEEGADRTGSRDSLEELEAPALRSSTGEHRIVDIEPRTGTLGLEAPQEEGDPSPSSAETGDRREEINEWPSLEEQRRRAEEEYGKLGGLSHGCRQSWDLKLREEKGPGRKINGLFHWISEDSLVLHEVVRAAGLEGHGPKRKVNTLCMRNVESTCAYWVPLTDWKGETKYLGARGEDSLRSCPEMKNPGNGMTDFPAWLRPGMWRPKRRPPLR